MLDYQHVLLATDLSAQSRLVAERAKQITAKSQAKLSIIHVIEHSPVAYGGEFSMPIDINLEQALEKHATEALATLSNELNITNADQYIETGSIKTAVVELAKKINIDLIVVGTHKHHGIEVLLGSRANAILHMAPCDVWMARV